MPHLLKKFILTHCLGSVVDCEKLLIMLKRQGYRGVTYWYLLKSFGLTLEEAEKCAKKVGVDLGHGVLLLPDEF